MSEGTAPKENNKTPGLMRAFWRICGMVGLLFLLQLVVRGPSSYEVKINCYESFDGPQIYLVEHKWWGLGGRMEYPLKYESGDGWQFKRKNRWCKVGGAGLVSNIEIADSIDIEPPIRDDFRDQQ